MNILIIQEVGGHEKNAQFKEALNFQRAFLRMGHSCVVWGKGYPNFNESLDSLVNQSDVLLLLTNYDTEWVPDLSRYLTPKIFWSIDAHCVLQQHLELLDRHKINHVLSSTYSYCNQLSKSRIRHCSWFPNAYPSDLIDIRPEISKTYDVGFCGNIMNRENWLKHLSNTVELHHDRMVIGEDMVRAVCSYKIHWNRNYSVDTNRRIFETLGCGTFLLTNFTDRLDDLFAIREHLVIYDSPNDCVEKVKYYLEHEKEREDIAKAGYEYVKQWHTFDCRAKQFIDIVNNRL